MRLRAIELTNVRRFAGRRASLSGIGDGITVLSEPNEFGKSTFFDALHALFFERHRSTRAPVKALQPHAGGAPEVAVEIELPDGRFRIAKRWLSRPQARVADGAGRLVAQEDEAEAWLDRLTGGDLAGPSGLLWVRQGLLGLEPEGSSAEERRERERGLATRRDLLSSVAGEIEMMTGGRRMDAVLDRVAAELALLATATGRPKAGGDWAGAVEAVAELERQENKLRPQAERLSGDLARRADAQKALAGLNDAALVAARAAGLRDAEAAHQAALAHRAEVERADATLRLATLDEAAAVQEVGRLDRLAARAEAARSALVAAAGKADSARARAAELGARDGEAAARAEQRGRDARDLRARLTLAERARLAWTARDRAAELQQRLDRAAKAAAMLEGDRARRSLLTVTQKAQAAAEAAQGEFDRIAARAEAQAVTIEALPAGGARATVAGAPLGDGPQPILAPTEITLPGFGALRVDPGIGQGTDLSGQIAAADAALARALAACGAANLAEARRRWAQAQELDAAIRQAGTVLAEAAPEGMEALRESVARALAAAAQAHESGEDAAALETALAAAEAGEAEMLAAARAAHDQAVSAGEARAEAEGERRSAERRLADALAEAGDPGALAAEIATLRESIPALSACKAAAAEALRALSAASPDLDTATARLARAKGAAEQARREEEGLRQELATLDTRIGILAEEGIEETLSELAGRRAEVEARAARYEAEVRALSRLRQALDAARAAARDAYFGPVLHELQPLLSILYPGAVLQVDDQSLLPGTLTRDGQAESIGILSGGTREQVAVLTRLAFARLFARSGQPVPVILDDALVHSDDDRIEAMFTALHRVARDQQILVFTCRQRAFSALGGERAHVRVEAA